MATASFSTIAKDDLSCPVCFELLTDPHTPKLLDCPHICCAVCIQKLIDDGKENFECPECRYLTYIPGGRVQDMRTVLQVRSLAETHKKMRNVTLTNVFHEKRKHTVKIVALKCSEHHASVDYYCRKCNITGCNPCMMKKHSGPSHDYVKIQDECNRQLEEMDMCMKNVSEKIDKHTKRINELDDLEVEIQRTIDNQIKNTAERVEQAIRMTTNEGEIMISRLQMKAEHIDLVEWHKNWIFSRCRSRNP